MSLLLEGETGVDVDCGSSERVGGATSRTPPTAAAMRLLTMTRVAFTCRAVLAGSVSPASRPTRAPSSDTLVQWRPRSKLSNAARRRERYGCARVTNPRCEPNPESGKLSPVSGPYHLWWFRSYRKPQAVYGNRTRSKNV